jgi:hypothetical protein
LKADPAACTLLRGGVSPAPISEAQKPESATSAKCPDEAVELLDDFLIALLDLPGDAWPDLAAALSDELFDRVARYVQSHLS